MADDTKDKKRAAEEDTGKFVNDDGTLKTKVAKTDLYMGYDLIYRAGDVVPLSAVERLGAEEGDLVDADSDEGKELRDQNRASMLGFAMNTGAVSGKPSNTQLDDGAKKGEEAPRTADRRDDAKDAKPANGNGTDKK